MNKVVRLGTAKTYRGRSYSIFCRIKYENGKLSITGVEGPTAGGNAIGACGQIDMHLRSEQHIIKLAPGWSRATLARFFDIWGQWHLNDMKAGTPMQEAYLIAHASEYEAIKAQSDKCISHYEWAADVLNKAGLNPAPDRPGYAYGTKWLSVEVPSDVVEFLESLPDTDRQPAWV